MVEVDTVRVRVAQIPRPGRDDERPSSGRAFVLPHADCRVLSGGGVADATTVPPGAVLLRGAVHSMHFGGIVAVAGIMAMAAWR
jgi:hypothetical protein